MNKNNELEKEERTIFIVLSIIVMIAIGVLVTWYFTKDKKEETEDKDTKTKTVEKQKKKDIGEDSSKYTFVPTVKEEQEVSNNVIAINNEEEKTPVVVVNSQTSKKEEQEEIEESYINYNQENDFYVVNEKINFANFNLELTDGSVVSITNPTIKSVRGISNIATLNDEEIIFDVTGKYIIDNSKIKFLEKGTYKINIYNNGDENEEYEFNIAIISLEEFDETVNDAITEIEEFLNTKNKDYYDSILWDALVNSLENFKNMQTTSVTIKREDLFNLAKEYIKLENSNKEEEVKLTEAKNSLTAKIAEINDNYKAEDYTEESYNNLKSVLETANQILNQETSLTEINAIIQSIDEAVSNLQLKTVTNPEDNNQEKTEDENSNSSNNIEEPETNQEETINII
ncbi:MAG TPA: hypothetical protein OIM63_06170 [Bacilli bacterium]|nr:hypothetical protein [Bacilli bacterium]